MEILLPKKIVILKHCHNMTMSEKCKGFSIFFENIIYPLKQEYDVIVDCKYGENLGTHWYIEELPDENFDIKIKVYNEEGHLKIEKGSKIEVIEKAAESDPFSIICIGDSITRSCGYMEHLNNNLSNIVFCGTRGFNQKLYHEGRGGWQAANFLGTYKNSCGVSPFLFPKGIEAKEYYGDIDFAEIVMYKNHDEYSYDGYSIEPVKYGEVFHRDEKLYRHTSDGDLLICENPQFEYRFDKYIEKYDIENPDAILIFLGANDLQLRTYEETEKWIDIFINNIETMIRGIHSYNKDIAIILCLPIIGAEQYGWGKCRGCAGGSKLYRFIVQKAAKKMLDKWDGAENIFIAPTLLNLDPINDFPFNYYKSDVYSENVIKAHCDCVHPNHAGYSHIGDSIAGVIELIRKEI